MPSVLVHRQENTTQGLYSPQQVIDYELDVALIAVTQQRDEREPVKSSQGMVGNEHETAVMQFFQPHGIDRDVHLLECC